MIGCVLLVPVPRGQLFARGAVGMWVQVCKPCTGGRQWAIPAASVYPGYSAGAQA